MSATEFVDVDLVLAFDAAPVGLCVLRSRVIQRCNRAFAQMFGYSSADLLQQSMAMLYPSDHEYAHIGELGWKSMQTCGKYVDERIMRRGNGELFWCHSSGQAMDRNDPYALTVWMFEDISDQRPLCSDFTVREREIVQGIVDGKTSKQIAMLLGVSHRTIDAHRVRLMRKLQAKTPAEMLSRLARTV